MSGTRGLEATERLVFALDVPDLDRAGELVDALAGHVGQFKIGLELFTAAGPAAVERVRAAGAEVFLDLKLHDIPATVARAAGAASALGVRMLTIHASGGARMIAVTAQSVREAAGAAGVPPPSIMAVTALTSLSARDLAQVGLGDDVETVVGRLARLAHTAGADGLVVSPQEVPRVRALLGPEAVVVTPGVRPEWDDRASSGGDDQRRVATPASAIAAGADYIVVGRPIRDADDPAAAAQRVVDAIERGVHAREADAGRNSG